MMPGIDENFSELKETFDFIDHAVFALMLIICMVIGLYFGYQHSVKKSANATLDYLLGGKNVHVFPGEIESTSTKVPTNNFCFSGNVTSGIFCFWNHFNRHKHGNLCLRNPVRIYFSSPGIDGCILAFRDHSSFLRFEDR